MTTPQDQLQENPSELASSLTSISTPTESTAGIVRQKSFKVQNSGSKSQNRRADERVNNNIRDHVLIPPRWDNSFRMQNATLAAFNILAVGTYAYCWYTGRLESLTWKIVFGISLFLLYVMDCSDNGLINEFENVITFSEFENLVNDMRKLNIKISLRLASYHNVQTRQTGKRLTRDSRRVETYNEKIKFPIGQVIDSTADATKYFEKAQCFRVHNFVTYSYADQESGSQFEALKSFYNNKAKLADKESESNEIIKCKGIKDSLFVYKDGTKVIPLFSKRIYFLYCILGLSLLYRVFLNRRVPFLEHCVHKDITYDPSKEPEEFKLSQLNIRAMRDQSKIIQEQKELIEKNQQILQQQQQVMQSKQVETQPNPNE